MDIRVHGGTPGMIKKKENLKRRYEIHQRAEERWESFALLRKMWDRSVYSSSSQPYDPLKWSNILLVTPYQGLGCQCGLEREFSIIIWRCLTCLKGWKYPILHKKKPTIIIEKLGKINSTLCYRNFFLSYPFNHLVTLQMYLGTPQESWPPGWQMSRSN